MKDYIEIKRHSLAYYKETSFLNSIKRSGKEHGYVGFLGSIRYFLRRLADYYLQVLARSVPFSGIRIKLQRMRGVKIGKHVHLGTLVKIDDAFPNFCIIEDGVSLAGTNYILTHNKPLVYHKNLTKAYVAPVIIKKNAWIAINVTILPGVTIGKGAIIASGSVVTKDIPANTIWGGVPAKQIREFRMEEGIPIGYK